MDTPANPADNVALCKVEKTPTKKTTVEPSSSIAKPIHLRKIKTRERILTGGFPGWVLLHVTQLLHEPSYIPFAHHKQRKWLLSFVNEHVTSLDEFVLSLVRSNRRSSNDTLIEVGKDWRLGQVVNSFELPHVSDVRSLKLKNLQWSSRLTVQVVFFRCKVTFFLFDRIFLHLNKIVKNSKGNQNCQEYGRCVDDDDHSGQQRSHTKQPASQVHRDIGVN